MANTGAHCHENMHVTAPKSVKMEGCVAKDMIWRKGMRSCLTKVAMVTILLALQSTATTARQCTVIPAGSPSNQSASSALAKNTTFNSTNSTVGLATPTTTPRPATQAAAEFQIAENPVSSNVNNQAAKITSDLDALNQTVRNITHRGFFPDVQLNDDVESGVAVLLIVIGVFCSTLGAQYGKILFVVMAFLAGVIISMYPIDSLLGNTLCGPFPCSPTGPGDEFCGWSMAAGVAVGCASASASFKIFSAGIVAVGACMAFIPALLLQPAFDLALAAYPQWTHYMHYIAFCSIGAGLAFKYPHHILIAISAVVGALLLGFSISYFLHDALTTSAISTNSCTSVGCIGMAVATGVFAVLSTAFQTWYKRRREKHQSGEDMEDKLDANLAAQRRVLERLEAHSC